MCLKLIKKVTTYSIKLLLRPLVLIVYFLSGFFPRNENLWVFGSGCGKRFVDNPKWFYYYCCWRKNYIDNNNRRYVWISKDKKIVSHLRSIGKESYYLYTIKGIYYCLRAKVYIFDNNPSDICYLLSRKALKVNLWHGSPLKKIIWDALDKSLGKRRTYLKKKGLLVPLYKFLHPLYYYKIDLLTASSHFVKTCFASAFYIDKDNIMITGYPRNDVFFDLDYVKINLENELVYNTILKLKHDFKKKIIIYMPTFRDTELTADNMKWEDLLLLDKFLNENNCVFIYKKHFLTKNKINIEEKEIRLNNVIFLDAKVDPYPILKVSDVLITDYSSVFFDYMLMDKPIIFYPYDLANYLKNDRDLYVDNYDNETPGPKAYNIEQLLVAIKNTIEKNNIEYKNYKMIKRKYNELINSSYSERVYFCIQNLLQH